MALGIGNAGRRSGGAIPTVPTTLVNGSPRTTANVGDALTVLFPSVGLTAPTQQALRDGTSISGATGYLYTIVTADAGATEITFTGTDLAGAAYTTAGVKLASNIVINSSVFTAGGAGTAPSLAIDYDYNRDLDLTLTLDFRNGGGTVLDTLTVTPFVAGPITIEGLESAAEGAEDVLVTITDGSASDTAVTAVSGLDATAPFVSTFNPADGATDVVPESGNLVVTFAEAIFKGAGSITIGGVSVAIADCTVSGSTLTIPYSGLAASTLLTPTWPAGFVKDAQGNPVAALTDEWSFTTKAPVTLARQYLGRTAADAGEGSNKVVGGAYNAGTGDLGLNGLVAGQVLIVEALKANGGAGVNHTLTLDGQVLSTPLVHQAQGGNEVSLWLVTLAADTTASTYLKLTDASGGQIRYAAYLATSMNGVTIATNKGARGGGVSTPISLNVATGNGFVIAGMSSLSTTGTPAWTGITKDADIPAIAGRLESIASAATTVTETRAISIATGDTTAMAAAVVSVYK